MYVWNNGGGKDVCRILYSNISEVDYDETSISIEHEYITLREGTGVYMSDSMVEKVLDEYEKNNKKLDHSQRIFYREKLKDIYL